MGKRRYARSMIIISILSIIALLIFLNTLEQDPIPVIKETLQQKKTMPDSGDAPSIKDIQPQKSAPDFESRQIPLPPRPEQDAMSYIEPTRFKNGIYWKIEKAGYKTSYLLGTVHVDDPRVIAVTKIISKNFNKADTLCTEIKLDYIAKIKFATEMIYSGKGTLKNDIGEDLYRKVKTAIRNVEGVRNTNIDKLKPWAVWVLLVMPIPKAERLDDRLHRDAILQRKKLCGLENVDDHIGVLTKTPLKDQVRMLEFAVDNLSMIKQQSRDMVDLYVERSLEKIYELMKQAPMLDDKVLINDYFYRLVIKRNVIMTNSMLPYLTKGNSFFAVGALHLPGKTGILQLLESRGFVVTRLY